MTLGDDQKSTWSAASQNVTTQSILERLTRPCQFQAELAQYIDSRLVNESCVVAEIGCESGVTLFLTQKPYIKIFLDYDNILIEKVSNVAKSTGTRYFTCSDDMFNITSIEEGTVDLAFNSGVIEHYLFDERVMALAQIRKILKPGGLAVIAYPNHYSIPYRHAYKTKFSLGPSVWPWPEEYKIANLSAEFREAGIEYEGSIYMDSRTVPGQYSNILLSLGIRALSEIVPSQRYLKVCFGRKL